MASSDGNITINIKAKDQTGGVFGGVSSKIGGLAKSAGVAAGAAVAAGGAAIVGIGAVAANQFIAFEDSMNEVFTLLPGISGSAMEEMQGQVLSASREMGRLPDEIIPALYQSLSAGVPPNNVFEFLDTAHMAALGGVTELETAVDGITSVVNAYGSEVVSAGNASDVMFTAVRLGKTTFGELSSNLSKVIPVASSMGISFEDVAAGIATMTAQGTNTAQATTQMNQMFSELSKGSSQVAGIFEEIAGQSFPDFISSGGNVQEALQLLEQYAIDNDASMVDLFGSIEAGKAALQLTGGATESFSANLEAMANSAGATETAYETMNQGLARTWEQVKATIVTKAIEIGDAMSPLIAIVGDLVMNGFDLLQPAIDAVSGAIETFSGVATSFFANIEEGMTPLDALIEALWDIAPPELLASLVDFRDNVLPALTLKFTEIKDAVLEFVTPIAEWIAKFVSWKDVIIALGLAIGAVIVSAIAPIVAAIATMIAIVTAITAVVAVLRNAWENDWGGIRTKLTAVWEGYILPAFNKLKEWLDATLPVAIEVLRNFWENVLLPAIKKVQEFWENTLHPLLQRFVDSVMPLVNDIIQVAADFFENVLKPALELVWAFIEDFLAPVLKALAEVAFEGVRYAAEVLWILFRDNVLPILKDLWEFIKNSLLGIFENLKGKIDSAKAAFDSIRGAIEAVVTWLQNVKQAIADIGWPEWLNRGGSRSIELNQRTNVVNTGTGNVRGIGSATDLNGSGGITVVNKTFNLNVRSLTDKNKVVQDFELMEAMAI